MPTNKKRCTINLPWDIQLAVEKECKIKKWGMAKTITNRLIESYEIAKKQPMLFGHSQLVSVESAGDRPHVFGEEYQRELERTSKPHEAAG